MVCKSTWVMFARFAAKTVARARSIPGRLLTVTRTEHVSMPETVSASPPFAESTRVGQSVFHNSMATKIAAVPHDLSTFRQSEEVPRRRNQPTDAIKSAWAWRCGCHIRHCRSLATSGHRCSSACTRCLEWLEPPPCPIILRWCPTTSPRQSRRSDRSAGALGVCILAIHASKASA